MFLGRVVRPGVDSAWLDTDRGYALAWRWDKAETCSCGTRHEEWDPKAGGDRNAYVPEVHYCRGHEVLAQAQEMVPKDSDGRPMPGFIPYLRPYEPPD